MIVKHNCVHIVDDSNTIKINMSTIKFTSVLCLLIYTTSSFGQSEIELPIEEQFDVVAIKWLDKSKFLKTYNGVNEYCQNPSFRKSVDRVLSEIHSYDSLILSKMGDPKAYFSWNKKEEKKTLADVKQMEIAYGMDEFVNHMREMCVFRNEIEAKADELRNGVGVESYDAKILLLETDMTRFMNKVDRLVLKIDDHLHVLHIDQ